MLHDAIRWRHDACRNTHYAGLSLGGASRGGGARGSLILSSKSGLLFRTLLTARLTAQRCIRPSSAGCMRLVGYPALSPSHTGKCSSSRITGIPSYSACIVALAGVIRKAKLRRVSLFGPASPPHRQTPAVRRPSGELHKAACRPASRAIRKRHLHAPGTGGVPGR